MPPFFVILPMSLHIAATPGQIAETMLFPGDPLRAKFIAETFLEHTVCYNTVRNMLGYSGTYQGKKISVQGSGMGMPSLSIYTHELIKDYGVKTFIRVGTCGAFREDIDLGEIIIAMGASTDSSMNRRIFKDADYAPVADPILFVAAIRHAERIGLKCRAGSILSTDSFYQHEAGYNKVWADYGVLGADMESSALYTICAKNKARALSLLTVSDNLVTGAFASQQEREASLHAMVELALALV